MGMVIKKREDTQLIFAGLQKLTLLDYPGHTACTVFTQGCDCRCPFCHNSSLLSCDRQPEYPVTEEEVLALLAKRKGILDGVCITGGEPLLHPELHAFIRRVREAGFAVKLDTNGCHPSYLRELIEEKLLDMVAMDIKNSPEAYGRTVGVPRFDMAPVRESAALLQEGRVPYEFRTTVVEELHTPEGMRAVGEWLKGDSPYYLQRYTDSGHVLHPGLHAPSDEKMASFRDILLPYLPNTALRGQD